MDGRLTTPRAAAVAGAAFAYFAAVFAAGFGLAALRVLIVAPRLGELAAVLLEAPLMLLVSWLVCGAVVRRFAIQGSGAGLAMGLAAFALLMGAEYALAALAFGRAPAEILAGYVRPAGLVGLAAQIAFALFPLLRAR